jgi:hypothetical protein
MPFSILCDRRQACRVVSISTLLTMTSLLNWWRKSHIGEEKQSFTLPTLHDNIMWVPIMDGFQF